MRKFFEKVKNLFTINVFIDLCVIAIIIIGTLFPTLFDPEHANWKNVVSNFVFSVAIVLLTFISGMNSSRLKEVAKDYYKNAKSNHINLIHRIQERRLSKYQELYVKDYNKKSLEQYAREIFQQYEIKWELYDCDISLIKTALKNKIIDKNQYSIIKLIRSGKCNYSKFDIKDLTSTQILKKQYNSNKSMQTDIIISSILSKLSWMVAFAIIFGTFVPDQLNGGVSAQSWINLMSRILTFVGGNYCGMQTGKDVANDDIRLFDLYFNFNSKFIQEFDLGIWKPIVEEDEENIIERLKALQNAENNVVKDDDEEEYQEIELTEEEYKRLQEQQNQ